MWPNQSALKNRPGERGSAVNGSPDKRRRLLPRLQFSLRLLLLGLTAFAIGFPIWYRWPYQTVVEERDPKTGKVITTRASTWQRQWGAPPLRHGPERFEAGNMVAVTNYVRGKKEGPYHAQNKTKYRESGQYHDDMKEGTWIRENRGVVTNWNWHEGKSHGVCQIDARKSQRRLPSGKPRMLSPPNELVEMRFDNGRLTHINGRPVHDALFDRLERGEVDEQTASTLTKEATVSLIDMPLKDTALYFAEVHRIPVIVDADAGVDVDQPVTGSCEGMQFGSLLAVIAGSNGVACDYRYGMLWITTPEDADDWHDPTGLADIVPPKDSPLARAWNEPVAVEAMNMPLATVLSKITERLAIDVDVSAVQPTADEPGRLPFTGNVRGLPFRHALGYLLYKTGCRCRLEDGQLTILPPSEQPAKAQ
jgi:hypothetical protein